MDKKFTNYLQSLGMGSIFLERMSRFYDRFMRIADEPPKDLFVSEYLTEDGQRQFTGAFFISEGFVYEVEELASDTPKMWMAKLAGNVAYIGIHPKDFDFHEATPASRLILECGWRQGTTFDLKGKASGENCSHLLEVVMKYLKPNLM